MHACRDVGGIIYTCGELLFGTERSGVELTMSPCVDPEWGLGHEGANFLSDLPCGHFGSRRRDHSGLLFSQSMALVLYAGELAFAFELSQDDIVGVLPLLLAGILLFVAVIRCLVCFCGSDTHPRRIRTPRLSSGVDVTIPAYGS